MKTYEIKMNRSRWYSLIVFVLCVAMIVVMLSPYFSYGKKTSTFVTANGNKDMLYGKSWLLSGTEKTSEVEIDGTKYTVYPEGYKRVDIDEKGKATLYSANVLRVNQVVAFNAFVKCVANYNEIAQAYEESLAYEQEAVEIMAFAEEVSAVLLDKINEDKGLDTLPVTGVVVSEESTTKETETQEQKDNKSVTQWTKNSERRLEQIHGYVAAGKEQLQIAEDAVKNAYEAVVEAYDVDVTLPWIAEDTEKYIPVFKAAYPDEYNEAYVTVADEEFAVFLAKKYPDDFAPYVDEGKALDRLYTNVSKNVSEDAWSDLKKAYIVASNGLTGENADEAIVAMELPEANEKAVNDQFVKILFGKLDQKSDAYKYEYVQTALPAFKDYMAKKYPVEYKNFQSADKAKDNLYTFIVSDLGNEELEALYEEFIATLPEFDAAAKAAIIDEALGAKVELKYSLNSEEKAEVEAAPEMNEAADNEEATEEAAEEAPAAEPKKIELDAVNTYDGFVALLDTIGDRGDKDALLADVEVQLDEMAAGMKANNALNYDAAIIALNLDAFKDFLAEKYPEDYAKLSNPDLDAKENFYYYKFTPYYDKNDTKSANKYFDEFIKNNGQLTPEQMIEVLGKMDPETTAKWMADGAVDSKLVKQDEELYGTYVDAYVKAFDKEFKEYLREQYPEDYVTAGLEYKEQKKGFAKFVKAEMKKIKGNDKKALYAEFVEANGELKESDEKEALAEMTAILAGKMSDEKRDTKTYGALDKEISKSNKAAAKAAAALKNSESAVKNGGAKQTSEKALKDRDFIIKQIGSMNELEAAYDLPVSVLDYNDVEPETGDRYDVKNNEQFEVNAYDLEKAVSGEDMLMATEVKVSYKDNNNELTFTFANGDEKKTTYAAKFNYDSKKTLSVLGYVAFPTDYAEFEKEISAKIQGYFINDVVLVPILMFILCVVGAVLALLKKDSFACGICAGVAGLMGVIAYLTSQFLKLGTCWWLHFLFCIALLIVGGLHAYFGIKEVIAEKKKIEEISI